MPRRSEAIIEYLPANESFTWEHRNMPVYPKCKVEKGEFFCVTHKVLLPDTLDETRNIDQVAYYLHMHKKAKHVLVWYCHIHQLMEEA